MFLKFCVTNTINEFITINGLNSEMISLFDRGAIDLFMPVIKQHQLNAKQGAVLVISGTIINAAHSDALLTLKNNTPELYQSLESLWNYCATLIIDDEHHWRNLLLINDTPEHAFQSIQQCA